MANLVDGRRLGHDHVPLGVEGVLLEKVADAVAAVEEVVVADVLLGSPPRSATVV